jgi:hypothetical protein
VLKKQRRSKKRVGGRKSSFVIIQTPIATHLKPFTSLALEIEAIVIEMVSSRFY